MYRSLRVRTCLTHSKTQCRSPPWPPGMYPTAVLRVFPTRTPTTSAAGTPSQAAQRGPTTTHHHTANCAQRLLWEPVSDCRRENAAAYHTKQSAPTQRHCTQNSLCVLSLPCPSAAACGQTLDPLSPHSRTQRSTPVLGLSATINHCPHTLAPSGGCHPTFL